MLSRAFALRQRQKILWFQLSLLEARECMREVGERLLEFVLLRKVMGKEREGAFQGPLTRTEKFRQCCHLIS
jgi:hypothetical protein